MEIQIIENNNWLNNSFVLDKQSLSLSGIKNSKCRLLNPSQKRSIQKLVNTQLKKLNYKSYINNNSSDLIKPSSTELIDSFSGVSTGEVVSDITAPDPHKKSLPTPVTASSKPLTHSYT